jgi:hypothetical protein
VTECEVDDSPDLARDYKVLNVPAVAVEGRPETLLVGAHPAAALVHRFTDA